MYFHRSALGEIGLVRVGNVRRKPKRPAQYPGPEAYEKRSLTRIAVFILALA